MNEVTKINPKETAPVADPMVSMIERVLSDTDIPMERVTALIDIRERQLDKEAEQAFNAAFAAAMAEMPEVRRTGTNKHLGRKYATLDDLIRASRPVLSKHGLSLNWQTGIDGESIRVTAIVRHALGHSIETTQHGQRDKSGSMNHLQGGGSTETYLKRYTGFAILGLSSGDEVDDDGVTASGGGFVNKQQLAALKAAIDHSGMSPTKFSEAYGHKDPENADLAEFPADKFDDAIKRLQSYAESKSAQDKSDD